MSDLAAMNMCRSSETAREQHPAAVVDRLWREVSPATALKGLRQAATDLVEMLQDREGDAVVAFKKRLVAAGAPSLAEMRAGRVRNVFHALNRRRTSRRGKPSTQDRTAGIIRG